MQQHNQQHHQQQQQVQQQLQQQLQAEIARLRKALGEREEEVARLNTQASKLSRARDQELDKLKSSLTREREEKLAKQSAAHNKRLVAKEEEMATLKAALLKEKDKVRPHGAPCRIHTAGTSVCRSCSPPAPTSHSPIPNPLWTPTQELAKAASNQQKALRAKDEEMAAVRIASLALPCCVTLL